MTDITEQQHSHNLRVAAEIGGIVGRNSVYTAGLSQRIADTGKCIEDLTVAELLALHRQHCEFFNRALA